MKVNDDYQIDFAALLVCVFFSIWLSKSDGKFIYTEEDKHVNIIWFSVSGKIQVPPISKIQASPIGTIKFVKPNNTDKKAAYYCKSNSKINSTELIYHHSTQSFHPLIDYKYNNTDVDSSRETFIWNDFYYIDFGRITFQQKEFEDKGGELELKISTPSEGFKVNINNQVCTRTASYKKLVILDDIGKAVSPSFRKESGHCYLTWSSDKGDFEFDFEIDAILNNGAACEAMDYTVNVGDFNSYVDALKTREKQ